MNPLRVVAVATQGTGKDDEARLRVLLANFPAEFFPFDQRAKRRSFRTLLKTIRTQQPDLVVMEGTGWAGGMAVLLARLLTGVPYVVSSGDAVGPFVALHQPLMGPLFGLYERFLCRWSIGFIGWTPYLTGRAISFGAPRAMTAPGWAPFPRTSSELAASRVRIRAKLGIPHDALVLGIAGSLTWTKKVNYCYGYELVQALLRVKRPDLRILIVGDGDGQLRLKQMANEQISKSLIFTGRVPRDEVPDYLAAMDVASLPQSVDAVGCFRYSTKLSEYLSVGLPIITGQLPMAYDLDGGWLWRLPSTAPWDEVYIDALSELITRLTSEELNTKRLAVPRALPEFDRSRQVARVTTFLCDLLANRNNRS